MELGEYLKAKRLKKSLSQDELAKRTYTSMATIAKIEKGMSSPKFDTLKLICEVLGLKIQITDETLLTSDCMKCKYCKSSDSLETNCERYCRKELDEMYELGFRDGKSERGIMCVR